MTFYLHLVNVRWMIPLPTFEGDCFTAAIWYHSATGLFGQDIDTVLPIIRAIAATALELQWKGNADIQWMA